MLKDIKRAVGLSEEDDGFDIEMLMYINSIIGVLSQLGLKEADTHPIIDKDLTWEQFFNGRTDLEMIKMYIILRTRMLFDPPTSNAAIESIKSLISDYEWRIVNMDTVRR